MQESTRWITIESTILVTRASILYIAGGVPGTRYNSEVPVPGTGRSAMLPIPVTGYGTLVGTSQVAVILLNLKILLSLCHIKMLV